MTLFIADISSGQAGLRIKQLKDQGFSAVIIKCSEAGGYTNPYFKGWVKEAMDLDFMVSSYHYLHAGDWDRQAANILRSDPDPRVHVWMDAEAGAGLIDAVQVANRLRRNGQFLAGFYGPKPPAGYGGWWRARYLNDPSGFASTVYQVQGGDKSPIGWVGNDMWQFCQHGVLSGFNGDVDFSAFRGTEAQLAATGWFWSPSLPQPQPAPDPSDPNHPLKVDDMFLNNINGTVYLIGGPKAPYVAMENMDDVHQLQTVIPTGAMEQHVVEAIYGPLPANPPRFGK